MKERETMNTTLLEPSLLTLPPGHPGEGDAAYLARRVALSRLVASVDETDSSLPDVRYTESETLVWRAIMDRLSAFHEVHAASCYLDGFRRLGLSALKPPDPGTLALRLRRESGFGLVLTDGLLDARVFLTHLGKRRQPCTVYLRHESRPDYTPEPDLVHEAVGHAPMLMNVDAAQLNEPGNCKLSCACTGSPLSSGSWKSGTVCALTAPAFSLLSENSRTRFPRP